MNVTVTDAGLIEAASQRDIGNADTQRYEVQAAEVTRVGASGDAMQ